MKIPLKLPPGIVADDTDFSTGGYKSSSGIRFWRGLPETRKGHEAFSLDLLPGVCRTIFPWTDGDNRLTVAFGQHNGLSVSQSGLAPASITPASTAATGTITVTGTPTADQTFVVADQTFIFKASRSAPGEVTISASNTTQAANIVTALTADAPRVTATSLLGVVTVTAATSGPTGNAVTLTESATGIAVSGSGFLTGGTGFSIGQIDGAGDGYSGGGYGEGAYGVSSSADAFALTWSFGTRSFGELYANPRGQGIFVWENVTTTIAAPLTNAPAVCNSISVAFTDQVMAFGCTDVGGSFRASCIRISDIRDPTIWTPGTANTAQLFYLKGNGRIVRALPVGRYYFVWTDSELHLGTYSGVWDFEPLGPGGLVGPNAAIVVGQTAFWISPDLQFYACSLGGAPALIQPPCPIRDEFADNLAIGQNDKIIASSLSERGEVSWFYSDIRDGTGYENSRAIRLSLVDGAWAPDEIARTAMADAGPAPSPIGTTLAGQIYWHERGATADGAALTASLTTGGQYMDPAQNIVLLRGLWPDFRDQAGAINLTILSRFYPQDTPVEHGPFVIAPNANKVDLFVTGRIFDFKFESSSVPMQWRMGKPVFDAVVTGER